MTLSRLALSSVSRLARPKPLAMSRKPWTVSLTPGWDSSAVSSSTAMRWVSRPTFASNSVTWGRSWSSFDAATHRWRAARNKARVEVDQGFEYCVAVCRALGEQGAEGRGAFLGHVLDGCREEVLAGREVVLGGASGETPARSATTETVEPAQPCSARQDTAASRRRWRVARLRSCLGLRSTAPGAVVALTPPMRDPVVRGMLSSPRGPAWSRTAVPRARSGRPRPGRRSPAP